MFSIVHTDSKRQFVKETNILQRFGMVCVDCRQIDKLRSTIFISNDMPNHYHLVYHKSSSNRMDVISHKIGSGIFVLSRLMPKPRFVEMHKGVAEVPVGTDGDEDEHYNRQEG